MSWRAEIQLLLIFSICQSEFLKIKKVLEIQGL